MEIRETRNDLNGIVDKTLPSEYFQRIVMTEEEAERFRKRMEEATLESTLNGIDPRKRLPVIE